LEGQAYPQSDTGQTNIRLAAFFRNNVLGLVIII